MTNFVKEFFGFLKEYKIVSLAVAFVMGSASTALVNSLVKDIIMPFLNPLLADGNWREAVWHIGPVNLAYGSFLAELVNFIILAAVIFVVVRKLFRLDQESKV